MLILLEILFDFKAWAAWAGADWASVFRAEQPVSNMRSSFNPTPDHHTRYEANVYSD